MVSTSTFILSSHANNRPIAFCRPPWNRAIPAASSNWTNILAASPSACPVVCLSTLSYQSPTSRVCLALHEEAMVQEESPPHRHSKDDVQHWLICGATQLLHMTFSFIAMIALAITYFMVRLVKKRNQDLDLEACVDHGAMAPPTCIAPCGNPSRANDFSNSPLVVRRFAVCRSDESR